MLLSLLPPSCMVAPIRELANKILSTSSNVSSNTNLAQTYSYLNMDDIKIDPPRGKSPSSSKNNSRESSILYKASSVLYYEQMEIQSNNPLWSEQVEAEYTSHSSTSNVEENNTSNNSETSNGSKHRKQHEINEAPALNNTLPPHEASMAIDQHILDV